jgi:hypothetical protein
VLLAYDYPLLGVFWTLVIASLWILVILGAVRQLPSQGSQRLGQSPLVPLHSLPAHLRGVRVSRCSPR